MIYVEVCRKGEHHHEKKKKQLRGREREEVVEVIKNNFQGSSNAYLNAVAFDAKIQGVDNPMAAFKAETLRKALQMQKAKEFPYKGWIDNLIFTIDICRNYVNPIIQHMTSK